MGTREPTIAFIRIFASTPLISPTHLGNFETPGHLLEADLKLRPPYQGLPNIVKLAQ
jgi:hypothetical protein